MPFPVPVAPQHAAAPARALLARALLAHAPSVTVRQVTYHGWADAVRLSNGLVEAIVVPQIGRVMRFQFVGRPETDPLYEDPAWAGKNGFDAGLGVWANFGGDKLWPSPQSAWPGGTWPPDKAFDGDPYYAQAIPNGVRLISPVSAAFAARVFRSITLRPGQPRLYFEQRLVKDAHAPRPFPIGVWTITQVRSDATITIPTLPMPGQPQGTLSLSDAGITNVPPYYQFDGQTVHISHDPLKSHKISAWPSAGAIFLHYGSGLTFSEHFTPPAVGVSYAADEQPIEVYSSAGKPGNYEMELLGPLSLLKAGGSAALSAYWQLEEAPKPHCHETQKRSPEIRRALLAYRWRLAGSNR